MVSDSILPACEVSGSPGLSLLGAAGAIRMRAARRCCLVQGRNCFNGVLMQIQSPALPTPAGIRCR